MGIRVLGPLAVDGSEELARRDRVVLASLATSPGHPVSADQLSDALWGEHPPASAGKTARCSLTTLVRSASSGLFQVPSKKHNSRFT